MKLYILIILASMSQILVVHGDSDESEESHFPMSSAVSNDYSEIPEELRRTLNQAYSGQTYSYKYLSKYISASRRDGDVYQLQFRPEFSDCMGSPLIVGRLSQARTIVGVRMSFYNEDNDYVRGNDGSPMQYVSRPYDLGHLLDIQHQGFAFHSAICLITLQPDSPFDLRDLFFHFGHSSSTSASAIENSASGVITGPVSFSIDSPRQIYRVSITCPDQATCMWIFGNRVIDARPSSMVTLVFMAQDVGNRTLAYVQYVKNHPQILASLLLSILPSSMRVCNNLPKSPRNKWISAGRMSSPRLYFTATYLKASQLVLIAGGTSNGVTAQSTVDIYDPSTGCYKVSSMTVARMKHAATYFNGSDMVLITGGVGRGGEVLISSELVSINISVNHSLMQAPRHSHAVDIHSDSTILIVSGIGYPNNTNPIEQYLRLSSQFQAQPNSDERLLNLEGHSVTSLGFNGTSLIFGGYNGISYPGITLMFNGAVLENATTQNLTTIAQIAHHQATHIPSLRAVLITGGNNHTHVLSACYLYYIDSKTFIVTGSMTTPRAFHAAVLLTNGSVLITGGAASVNNGEPNSALLSVERYDPTEGKFTTVSNMIRGRYQHKALLHNGNEVFVIGGTNSDLGVVQSIELMILEVTAE